jgi:hypothetical protein
MRVYGGGGVFMVEKLFLDQLFKILHELDISFYTFLNIYNSELRSFESLTFDHKKIRGIVKRNSSVTCEISGSHSSKYEDDSIITIQTTNNDIFPAMRT